MNDVSHALFQRRPLGNYQSHSRQRPVLKRAHCAKSPLRQLIFAVRHPRRHSRRGAVVQLPDKRSVRDYAVRGTVDTAVRIRADKAAEGYPQIGARKHSPAVEQHSPHPVGIGVAAVFAGKPEDLVRNGGAVNVRHAVEEAFVTVRVYQQLHCPRRGIQHLRVEFVPAHLDEVAVLHPLVVMPLAYVERAVGAYTLLHKSVLPLGMLAELPVAGHCGRCGEKLLKVGSRLVQCYPQFVIRNRLDSESGEIFDKSRVYLLRVLYAVILFCPFGAQCRIHQPLKSEHEIICGTFGGEVTAVPHNSRSESEVPDKSVFADAHRLRHSGDGFSPVRSPVQTAEHVCDHL